MPPVTHHWKSDGLTCPALTSKQARAIGLSGTGKSVPVSQDYPEDLRCVWEPREGPATKVVLAITVPADQSAADEFWQSAPYNGDWNHGARPVSGVGEAAFLVTAWPQEPWITVRSGNATLSISLHRKKWQSEHDPEMETLAAVLPFIARDALAHLLPA
ncbi:hypothetical protein BJY16_009272 [Actinoplanes octamycinicus]|uniref:Uncharacterized protein n=1 Tax=Actinoplanes octamycinicus TaxID=135948 RepID=A0A7W7H858_9ACTN|nr:hypothetical protein [Actinoplanes octamycinicus]MBB4745813.1 hypothetical protein [Actinoplanes octamycinicus]